MVQDYRTLEVLMLAYVNAEAVRLTQESGKATFWSTSRNEYWEKGSTSGDYLWIKELRVDCDQDALIYLVEPEGGACHTDNDLGESRQTCFYRRLVAKKLEFIYQ